MMLRTILLMVFVTGLFSCSEPQTTADKPANKDTKETSEHMLSDQERMIQKAKDAEKLIEEADIKRRKALKDQSG